MDKIFLHGMKADTLIGVYDWERQHPQTLIFDLDIGLPHNAGHDDKLAATVHYGEVCLQLRQELASRDFMLLEALAAHTAAWLFEHFAAIQWLRIHITKPGILPDVAAVGVEIERQRLQAA